MQAHASFSVGGLASCPSPRNQSRSEGSLIDLAAVLIFNWEINCISACTILEMYLDHLWLAQGGSYHDRGSACPWCKHPSHCRRPHYFTLQVISRSPFTCWFCGWTAQWRGQTYWWVTEQEDQLIDIWMKNNGISDQQFEKNLECLPEGPRAQFLDTGCAVSLTLCIGDANGRVFCATMFHPPTVIHHFNLKPTHMKQAIPSKSIWNWNPFIRKISRFSMTTLSPTAVSSSGKGLDRGTVTTKVAMVLWSLSELLALTAVVSGAAGLFLFVGAQNCTFHQWHAMHIISRRQ